MTKMHRYYQMALIGIDVLSRFHAEKDFEQWVRHDYQAQHYFYKYADLVEKYYGDKRTAAREFLFEYLEDENLEAFYRWIGDTEKVDLACAAGGFFYSVYLSLNTSVKKYRIKS